MARLHYRSASVCVFGIAFVAPNGEVARARADDPLLTATMQCERAAEPGRVRCAVEARTTSERTIAWADVALLELPEFTAALKGRIAEADATAKDAASQRWAFGLVARKSGQGEARARVRALLCEAMRKSEGADGGTPRCAPVTVDVKASVRVG